MTIFRSFTDFFSMGLSAACAIHCLAWPLLAIIFPLIPAFQQDGENFHFSILLFAIPSSVVAMTMGCRLHKTYSFFIVAFFGLFLISAGPLFGIEEIGFLNEKIITVFGACLLVFAHYRNFKACNSAQRCSE